MRYTRELIPLPREQERVDGTAGEALLFMRASSTSRRGRRPPSTFRVFFLIENLQVKSAIAALSAFHRNLLIFQQRPVV